MGVRLRVGGELRFVCEARHGGGVAGFGVHVRGETSLGGKAGSAALASRCWVPSLRIFLISETDGEEFSAGVLYSFVTTGMSYKRLEVDVCRKTK